MARETLVGERTGEEEEWIKKFAKSTELTIVYQTDSANLTAYKIFGGFKVGQSCAIPGVEFVNHETPVLKYDAVWDKLMSLCKRKSNNKKFKIKEFGGVYNIYRTA